MKKRVLIVDDEPSIQTALKMLLDSTYQVQIASEGQTALDLFKQEPPHLVLLDVMLPGIDGLEVLKVIRAEDATVPVIMLTATKTVKPAVEAMKMGAADYLTKPFDAEELRLIVSRTLATQDLEREVRYLRAQVVNRYAFHNL
ncbi:MAG: response regulator, partial [Nitrospirales bacterium]